MAAEMTGVQRELFALQDLKYKKFHSSLMPTVDPDTVIGVRMPALRKYAAGFAKTGEAADFVEKLPHRYYEENNLHVLLINACKDFDETIELLKKFLPYMDNWATCDLCAPKSFEKHRTELLPYIRSWLDSEEPYTIRFGIGMLMRHYLEEDFRPEYPEAVARIRSEEYYVNMMIAWYFATALAKQYDAVLPFIERRRLDRWTHNKTIQKAVESYRITDEQKAYLKTLRVRSGNRKSDRREG